jgi:hypothetical protein
MNYNTFKELCHEEGVDHKDALDELAQQGFILDRYCYSEIREWLCEIFKPELTPHIEKVMQFIGPTGGGFMSRLTEAWFRADLENRAKIESTWAEEIQSYRERLIGDMKQRKLFKEEEK